MLEAGDTTPEPAVRRTPACGDFPAPYRASNLGARDQDRRCRESCSVFRLAEREAVLPPSAMRVDLKLLQAVRQVDPPVCETADGRTRSSQAHHEKRVTKKKAICDESSEFWVGELADDEDANDLGATDA